MSEPLYNSNMALNGRILYDEVFKHVMKAKNNKAVGFDDIPNEVLKNNNTIRTLYEMFSLIFDITVLPNMWLKAVINPIPKSNMQDMCIPKLYHDINLISCIYKIYSSLLNI